jgi:catechol 2,3-dioxygenase-like lactoylglutathione lyase family enzyme
MVTGINHVTFSVGDLQVSFEFYVRVLGLRPVARWARGAYLLAGELWITLILDESARKDAPDEYTHVALSVSEDGFDALAERIRRSEARIWQENETEGASLYFTDPDGHKLELATSYLAARIAANRKDSPEGMRFYV